MPLRLIVDWIVPIERIQQGPLKLLIPGQLFLVACTDRHKTQTEPDKPDSANNAGYWKKRYNHGLAEFEQRFLRHIGRE